MLTIKDVKQAIEKFTSQYPNIPIFPGDATIEKYHGQYVYVLPCESLVIASKLASMLASNYAVASYYNGIWELRVIIKITIGQLIKGW